MNKLRFLVFSLGQEQYGVPLLQVKEVLGITEITPIPSMPAFFKGIMNLRGQVISVIDLRAKLNIKKIDYGAETVIVILDLFPFSIGVIVDSVDSVLSLIEAEITPPPEVEFDPQLSYIQGVARKDKNLILLFNIEKALGMDALKGAHFGLKDGKAA